MSTVKQLKRKWQADAEFTQVYNALKPEFAIAHRLTAARNRADLSQAEVARKTEKVSPSPKPAP